MPDAFALGPLLLRTWPVALGLGVCVAVWASGRIAARRGLDARALRRVAEGGALAAVLAARGWHVATNWSGFADAPWTALWLWQPGYEPAAGVVAGGAWVAFGLYRARDGRSLVRLCSLGLGSAAGTAAAAALTLSLLAVAPARDMRAGLAVEDFELVTPAGEPVRFSSLRGRPVVLNFWASWCAPCRREMPLLDALQRTHAEHGLAVVGVNVGEPFETARGFAGEIGVRYAIWLDPPAPRGSASRATAVHARFGGIGLPTTVFVDRHGVVRAVRVGELPRSVLEQEVDAIVR